MTPTGSGMRPCARHAERRRLCRRPGPAISDWKGPQGPLLSARPSLGLALLFDGARRAQGWHYGIPYRLSRLARAAKEAQRLAAERASRLASFPPLLAFYARPTLGYPD
eukprot:2275573-Pyramimonas_sp.AAC.1